MGTSLASAISLWLSVMILSPKKRAAALQQHELPQFQPEESSKDKSRRATRLNAEVTIAHTKEAADLGMISLEAAQETVEMAEAINRKWGDGQPIVSAPPDNPAPAHDPDTGEISDPVPVAVAAAAGDDAAGIEAPSSPVPAADYEMPDIPEALDRRRRAA